MATLSDWGAVSGTSALVPKGKKVVKTPAQKEQERKDKALRKLKQEWMSKYDQFLRQDSHLQCLFACAEHLVLYNKDISISLPNQIELWGMRQQLYEGDCPFEWSPATAIDPKLNSWMQQRGKTPAEAATLFIKKVASLESGFSFLSDQQLLLPNSTWPLKHGKDAEKSVTPAFTLWNGLPWTLEVQTNAARIVQFYVRWKFVAKRAVELTLMKKEAAKNLRFVARRLLEKHASDAATAADEVEKLNLKADAFADTLLEGQPVVRYYDATNKPRKGLLKYDGEKQLLWCCPDTAVNRRLRKAPKDAISGKGIFVQDISEVRVGRHSWVFKKNESRGAVDVGLCLSLVGSATTLDIELKDRAERDKLAMNLEILVDAKISITKRARKHYEKTFMNFSEDSKSTEGRMRNARRKNLSFAESIEVKHARDELLINGLPVFKVSKTGLREPRFLWLIDPAKNIDENGQVDIMTVQEVPANLERMRLVVTRRRPNYQLHEVRRRAMLECEKGIDVADVSEIRLGLSAHNFNVMKDIDLRALKNTAGDEDYKNKCFSIVGSERTMCLEIDREDATDIRDSMINGLQLLLHVSPKPLGRATPQTIINVNAGREVLVLSNRLEYLLVSQEEKDQDEQNLVERGKEIAERLRGMTEGDTPEEEESGKAKNKASPAQLKEWSKTFESFDEVSMPMINGCLLHFFSSFRQYYLLLFLFLFFFRENASSVTSGRIGRD